MALALLVSCGDPVRSEPTATTKQPERKTSTTTGREGGGFEGIRLTLELTKTTFRPGGSWAPTLLVENESDRTVIDPDCRFSNTAQAIVPEDDPDAELWMVAITDCAGDRSLTPGHREEAHPPAFRAVTAQGDELPPGDYVAALEIRGFTDRLEIPVTIEETD